MCACWNEGKGETEKVMGEEGRTEQKEVNKTQCGRERRSESERESGREARRRRRRRSSRWKSLNEQRLPDLTQYVAVDRAVFSMCWKLPAQN